jgi:hypothetical protein
MISSQASLKHKQVMGQVVQLLLWIQPGQALAATHGLQCTSSATNALTSFCRRGCSNQASLAKQML